MPATSSTLRPVLDGASFEASVGPSARPRPGSDAASWTTADEPLVVRAAQAGDSGAFGALVRRHERRAYAVARAITGTHEDAEDAVQDGFLHAYRSLQRFRPEQPFAAWLHRIVANAALDLLRRRRVRSSTMLSPHHPAPFRDPAESNELHDRLSVALDTLSIRQRAVVVLHDVEGFKHAEIARLLDIPEGTARSDLHHARRELRRLLPRPEELR